VPAPAPFTGYTPGFSMPVIAPPPENFSGSAEDYYEQLPTQLAMAVSGPDGAFADFTLTGAPNAGQPPDPTLFAVTGGFVRHYPPGTSIPSPDNFIEPQQGVLMLSTWLGDIEAQTRVFPPDTPPIARVCYVGVDPVATALILRAEIDLMHDPELRASWKTGQGNGSAPPAGTLHPALVDAHKLRVMAGDASVFVTAGTAIGKAIQDQAAAVETYRFTLRMVSAGSPAAYVSPLPTFIGAPYYDL
jgi:hypothetical protein